MTTDNRHCWIWTWQHGRKVTACDRCERTRDGFIPERQMPEFGCPGSSSEQALAAVAQRTEGTPR